jgi:hypothetical protein
MYVTRATDGMIEATYVSHRVMPMIEGSLPDPVLESLVNIAHFGKIAVCGCSKQTTTCGELPKVINTDHHQKPACAGCIGLRSRPRPSRLSSTANHDGLSFPELGPLLWCGIKKPARNGLVFHAEKFGTRSPI